MKTVGMTTKPRKKTMMKPVQPRRKPLRLMAEVNRSKPLGRFSLSFGTEYEGAR